MFQGFLSRPVHPPDGLLDLFRGAGADEQAVLLADVLHEGLVKLIPGGGEAGGGHHAPQGGDRHVGGPTPDVHHHVALGLGDVHPGPQGGGQRLLHQVDPPGAGLEAGLHHRPFRYLGDTGGDADQQTGLQQPPGGGLVEEGSDHGLGDGAVGDDALPQRPHSQQVPRGPAQHLPGGLPHLEDGACAPVHSHHRGLLEQDAPAPYGHQHGGGAQIHGDIPGKAPLYLLVHIHAPFLAVCLMPKV